ncbi:MAG: adenylate/guanylate cyclase domain-containing protein, partial [Acidimicrobiia bacterium]|nr:adenylate/guanylate cyclase domain-containing protein [Acidimicrobiia bacterium]
MAAKPSGIVTFLFTDIEGSTVLWERDPTAMKTALQHHDTVVRQAIKANDGWIFSVAGDSFGAAFPDADLALAAATTAQQDLGSAGWPDDVQLQVRMGLHTGTATTERDGNYFGPEVNRAARIMSAANGGQVLVSTVTAGLAGGDVELASLGSHRLRDLSAPVELFQLFADGLETTFGPLNTLDSVRNNLPILRTSLVGRVEDIGEVEELLRHGRLVTLTGAGGVGKTTLGLAVAGSISSRFADGVFFVELAPLTSGDLIAPTIATAANLRLGSIGSDRSAALRAVADVLAGRESLVILDNCEHLVDEVATFVDELLSRGSAVKVLATSREPLSVRSERAFRVRSLELDWEDPLRCAAVELLVERAEANGADAAGLTSNPSALADLCERLDGIPLALELAAAQLPYLTPTELIERLDDRLDVMQAGLRGKRPARHDTLRAVVTWSWDLLDEAEKRLLSRLSVFVGGWSHKAAEHVCREPGDPTTEAAMRRLVAKSLVAAEMHGDRTRFRLLETVRVFAQEQLAATGDVDSMRDRHLGWLLDAFDPGFEDQYFSFEHLADYERDLDNNRAGIEWAIARGDHSSAARLVCGGSGRWRYGFGGDEGEQWVQTLLGAALPADLRARVLMAGIESAIDFADRELIAHRAQEATRLATEAGSDALLATLQSMAAQGLARRDPEASLDLMRRAASTALAARAPHAHALAVAWQAFPLFAQERLDEALAIAKQAVELSHPAHFEMQSACWMRFHAHLALRDCDQAREWLSRAEAVETDAGLRINWGWRFYETILEAWCGEPQEARRRLRRLVDVLDEAGTPKGRSDAALAAGVIALEEGDLEVARQAAEVVSGRALYNQGHNDVLYRFRRDLADLDGEPSGGSARARGGGID